MERTATGRGEEPDGSGHWAPGGGVGYAVHDPRGRRIGSVRALFLNERGEPEYVDLKVGLLGLRTALIPVQGVAVDEKRRILVLQ